MADHVPAHGAHPRQSFLRRYVFSTDHKVIGLQYLVTSMAMALVGGLLVMLMRMQLAWPHSSWPLLGKLFPVGMEGGLMKPEFYLSLMTMHGTIMVFFVVSLALLGGFGNFLIPLQIGARDMAFPFLNMLSFWIMVPACLVMLGSFLVEGGAAAAGWTAYPPLSAIAEAIPGSQMGQTWWIVGMALFIASFTMGGLNYVTTILNMRTKGMSLMRMPITIWSLFLASLLGLLAFPPLTAAAVMLLMDRHAGTSFFLPSGLFFGNKLMEHSGGTPLLWQHLFWFLGHPEVYVLILPALGITLEMLPVFTRKPLFGYRMTVYSLVTISFLGMIVWGHHMYVSGMSPYVGEIFAIGTLTITLPSAIVGMNMLASLWGGLLRLRTPMLFSIGSIVFFGTGGFGGIFLGNATSDIQLHDTYFVVGHFHLMIGGVTLMAIFAGCYYWFPKMFGRMMNEKLGKLHFWLTMPAFYGIFLAMHYIGLAGTPRRYFNFERYEFLANIREPQVWITIAAFLLFIGQFLFLGNFFASIFRGRPAPVNPWEAATLEWTTPSPAPHGNWEGEIPEVHRWAYDYNVPGASSDCTAQSVPAQSVPVTL
ncbi:MAG: cbb3-type cytochrome c oxidase subunit I [Acidobacteriia bacterium]|nr:cbb3-type cytochrome c oxidase subunit I [Terriglobia bacterium]